MVRAPEDDEEVEKFLDSRRPDGPGRRPTRASVRLTPKAGSEALPSSSARNSHLMAKGRTLVARVDSIHRVGPAPDA